MSFERKNIAAMQGYSYGEQPATSDIIKLNTNENPYPPSPRVQQAWREMDLDELRRYPDATAAPLRHAIAAANDLAPEQVVMTNGGDEALRLALTTFVEPGGGFGMAEPSYSLYPVLAAIADARVERVELDADWRLPSTACTRWNSAGCALTCLVNPHAPSGVLMGAAEVARIADAHSGVLLLDEAYVDFAEPDAAYNAADLLEDHANLLLLRTFSKGYALAGLRLGYLLGQPDLIRPIIEKTRDSYNVDHLTQALGLAAITDTEWAQENHAQVRADRSALAAGLQQLGLQHPPSHGNFLLASVPPPHNAQHLYQALRERNIVVRYFDTPALQDKLRITVGTQQANQRLIEALTELLEQ